MNKRRFRHAIVEELCGLGATVHTCARNEDELGTCLRSWKDEGFTVSGSLCDVSSQVDHQKLMEVIVSAFNGKLNILINNAGTNIRKDMVDFTAEDVSCLMATNFESVSAGLSPSESIRGWKCCVHFFCLRFCLIEIYVFTMSNKRSYNEILNKRKDLEHT